MLQNDRWPQHKKHTRCSMHESPLRHKHQLSFSAGCLRNMVSTSPRNEGSYAQLSFWFSSEIDSYCRLNPTENHEIPPLVIWPWVKIPYPQRTSLSPLKQTKTGGAPTNQNGIPWVLTHGHTSKAMGIDFFHTLPPEPGLRGAQSAAAGTAAPAKFLLSLSRSRAHHRFNLHPGVDFCLHSVQPSFFSKTSRFPWVSRGFLEGFLERMEMEGTPRFHPTKGRSENGRFSPDDFGTGVLL